METVLKFLWYEYMIKGYYVGNPIEFIAAFFGLVCVWYTVKQNIWCWPTGLIQVLLYIFVFQKSRLYSDMVLQVFFVFVQIYGWYHWKFGGVRKNELKVSNVPVLKLMMWVGITLVGTFAWVSFITSPYLAKIVYSLFKIDFHVACPKADGYVAIASVVATWLMAQKKLESWLFWISVDVVAIPVYIYKNLYFTGGLYVVFLVLATMGYFEWRKSYKALRVN
jgi:nicotinamide mononucleotide transporter